MYIEFREIGLDYLTTLSNYIHRYVGFNLWDAG